MTDTATEPRTEAVVGLGEYLGKDIIRTSVKITKAGDGLSASLGISPEVFQQGEELMILAKVKVGQHIHKPIKDTECLELVQEFEALTVTIVDDKTSARRIAQQENELAKAAEKKKGTQRLPGTEDAIDGAKDGPDDDGTSTAGDPPEGEWEDPPRSGSESE